MNSTPPCAIVPLPHTVTSAAAFTPIAGRPALACTVRSLREHVADARLVVAASAARAAAVRDCLVSDGLADVAVTVVCEPVSRRLAIIAGLEYLGVQSSSSAPVLVADCGHPLATAVTAALVISGLREGHDVVVPALPVTDTVKTVDDVGSVLSTVDRSALRTVQFPRGFTASALWELVTVDTGADEFTAALRAGLAISTVDGNADAFQVELPRDARLLDAISARP